MSDPIKCSPIDGSTCTEPVTHWTTDGPGETRHLCDAHAEQARAAGRYAVKHEPAGTGAP